jgi:hypothetical protein
MDGPYHYVRIVRSDARDLLIVGGGLLLFLTHSALSAAVSEYHAVADGRDTSDSGRESSLLGDPPASAERQKRTYPSPNICPNYRDGIPSSRRAHSLALADVEKFGGAAEGAVIRVPRAALAPSPFRFGL